MGELSEPMPTASPTMTELLVAALRALGLSNAKGATKLDAVLSGFNRLSDALGAARNEIGPVAHGKDGFLDSVTIDHARTFLHVGDAILGILLNALEGKEPDLTVTREPYETFKHLNERIDRDASVQVRIDEESDPQLSCSQSRRCRATRLSSCASSPADCSTEPTGRLTLRS